MRSAISSVSSKGEKHNCSGQHQHCTHQASTGSRPPVRNSGPLWVRTSEWGLVEISQMLKQKKTPTLLQNNRRPPGASAGVYGVNPWQPALFNNQLHKLLSLSFFAKLWLQNSSNFCWTNVSKFWLPSVSEELNRRCLQLYLLISLFQWKLSAMLFYKVNYFVRSLCG